MRPTLDSEMPASRAIVLRDHCVALSGVVCVVLATTSATCLAVIVGVRPGRGASFTNPATPCARNRSRHREAISGATDLLILQAFTSQQDDAAALNHAHRRGPPPYKILQLRPCFRTQMDRWRYAHIGHLNCIGDDP